MQKRRKVGMHVEGKLRKSGKVAELWGEGLNEIKSENIY